MYREDISSSNTCQLASLELLLAGRLDSPEAETMGGGKSMNGAALQQRLLDNFFEQIKEDAFPSVTMMNRVEGSLRTREQVEEYAEVLLEKIEATRFPSISMLDRFDGLIARLD
jgi:hypothetical protein